MEHRQFDRFLEVLLAENHHAAIGEHFAQLRQTQFIKEDAFRHAVQEAIYQLMNDSHKNSFRIALALCLINSKNLDTTIRLGLGLAPEPPTSPSPLDAGPSLFSPSISQNRRWLYLCPESETKMKQVLKRAKNIYPKYRPYDLNGCLLGKGYGTKAGLCYRTTEFPSGAIFVKGIWYALRSYDLVERLESLEDTCATLPPQIHPEIDAPSLPTLLPMHSDGSIVWTNCGGIWQPGRAFNSGLKVDANYAPEHLQRFLATGNLCLPKEELLLPIPRA